jgi:uncharacterized protein YerC
MTNVSKRKTSSADYTFAYQQFIQIIATLKQTNAPLFFEEFFTEAEKVMFVKRFAVIFLLQHDHPPYRISTVLGISLSTVQRLRDQYQNEHFVNILKSIPKAQKQELTSLFEDFILSKVSSNARSRLLKRVIKK